ncbi:golgin subfamily A member 5 [Gadus morhua]|uniref:Golgin subfamily A member 5 n=1 Tax=Gadus morhua TaxID=8049 RepID=A0A8C5BUD9_GADMO|nr:golgin subfamily A member 5 [Gadus morhua]
MSWFTDLAGKAEDFLNKVDAGAATALQKENALAAEYGGDPSLSSVYATSGYRTDGPGMQQNYESLHDPPGFITAAAGNIKRSNAPLFSNASNVSSTNPDTTTPLGSSSVGATSSTNTGRASSGFVRRKKSEQDVDDDMLFDFLNSSDPPAATSDRKDMRRDLPKVSVPVVEPQAPPSTSTPMSSALASGTSTPHSTLGISRASSLSSLSTHSMKTSEEGLARDPGRDTPDGSDSGLSAPQDSGRPEPLFPDESRSQELSSLRLENQLLRNEVTSLNQEMASLIQRAKAMQEDLNQARLRSDKWNSDQSTTDRVVREFRSQVDDLTEALSAKDGQLAVLKIRLDEADQLLKSRNSALEAAQSEKSRLLQDQSEGSSMQSQALETLQQGLREAELTLRREQDNYRQMQSEAAVRLSRAEAERQTLAETVTAAERRAAEERRRADDLQQQTRSARAAAELGRQELQDYKHKASRILQSKEKLISSLKEGSGLDTLDSGRGAVLELEEMRHEKELQKEEVQRLQGQVHALRAEVQELESQAMSEVETWRQQQMELQDQQAMQIRAKQEAEAELDRHKQELQYLEEESHRTKASLQSRIKDREDEIQKLRNQLTNKALSSSSQVELESRLHQLTETLIQKQTMLEALGTEKSSLAFQLERLEQQLKSAQGGAPSGGQAIHMGSLEGAGARQRATPVLFSDQDSPGMYGQVRKAASTIDRFSIRLGIFLRRYPIARVFVILYIGLLHLWVMIVLLTYTPEMHTDHPGGR